MEYNELFECNNGFKILLSADSRGTRHGFAHDAKITVWAKNMFCGRDATAHCYYLNRTWEMYRYQTVLQRVCRAAMAGRADELLAAYKTDNGYQRMTKKRAAEFTETLNNDAEYTAINSVLQQL